MMRDVVAAIRAWGRASWGQRSLAWRGAQEPLSRLAMVEGLTAQTGAEAVSAAYPAIFEGIATGPDWLRLPVGARLARVQPLGLPRLKAAAVTGIAMFLAERRPHHLAGDPQHGSGVGIGSLTWALQQYPGVGPYTSAMVALLLGEDGVPPVDANLRRVGDRAAADGDGDRWLAGLFAACMNAGEAEGLAPQFGRPVRYELASHLMDLGHYVCTARRPRCGACPVRAWCAEAQGQPCLPLNFDLMSFGREEE
jgi:A/G-specific adenine glycosylase